jgi:riboflavin kinase, archaea type
MILMKIKGLITSGSQKGAFFMSQEVYTSQFREKLGFKPFKGTLNILLDEDALENVKEIKKGDLDLIKGAEGFGDVAFVKATINDQIEGALIFPIKTNHPEEFLEFIAPEKLRIALKLRDGDEVTLSI